MFASINANKFSREGLPGLSEAIVGSVVGSWPGGNKEREAPSTSIPQPQIGGSSILNSSLDEQFKFAISDKTGESELYKTMAEKVKPEDAIQLNYMAEQEEWNKDILLNMYTDYISSAETRRTPSDVDIDDIKDYKTGFSAEPTDGDYLTAEVFDVDPDVLSERRRKKAFGERVSPFVEKNEFMEDFVSLIGDDNAEAINDFYDKYLVSGSKSHLDYIKRLGIPSDMDVPVNYIKSEVSGVIPEAQVERVMGLVNLYEVEGGYVFVGKPEDVARAEEYIR